jgi:Tfp pilus assembly protein PilF
MARRDFPQAETELSAALRAEPGDTEIHYALARLYQQTGRKDAADHEFAVCAELHAQEQRKGAGIAGAAPQP